jgi:hypothetical protein
MQIRKGELVSFLSWMCDHIETIYRTMFLMGIVFLFTAAVTKKFSPTAVLTAFLIVASITAAYLWIRLDIWRDDQTILKSADQKIVQAELISRRADNRVAFFLLFLVAIAQALLLFLKVEQKSNWLVFSGMLLLFVPLFNWIARWIQKVDLLRFYR